MGNTRDGGAPIRKKPLALSLLITLAFLGWASSSVNVEALRDHLQQWQLGYVIPALLFYASYVWISGLRVSLLADGRINRPTNAAVNALGNYCRTMLPAGVGEIAYAALVRHFLVPTYADAYGVVIVSRALDVTVGTVLFTMALPLLLYRSSGLVMTIWAGMVTISAVLVALLLGFNMERLSRMLPHRVWGQKVRDFGADLGRYLESFKGGSNLWPAAIYTLVGAVALIGVYISVCFAIGKGIQWSAALYLYFMLWPMSLLPVRGLLDFGTHESGWVFLLCLLGYDTPAGLVIALSSHLMFLSIGTLAALSASGYLLYSQRRRVSGLS